MGGGTWSDKVYRGSTSGRSAFKYSADVLSKPVSEWRCHQLLDPYGLKIRESRDSAEHPESNAVIVGLDVTGSMGTVVVSVRDSLGKLMSMLLEGKYITDPQLLFYAVGDATCDAIPFQVSQFESDIRINEQITKVILEGGGGGQNTESYEIGFYFADKHTSIDCFEKRGKKGKLFTIGDELPYPAVNRRQVKEIFNANIQSDLDFDKAVKNASQKYDICHIIPRGSSHYNDPDIRNTWSRILGGSQFVFMLENPSVTAETIALAIGLSEGVVSFDEGLRLIAKNSGQMAVPAVRRALEDFAESVAGNAKNAKSVVKTLNGGKKNGKTGKKNSGGLKL